MLRGCFFAEKVEAIQNMRHFRQKTHTNIYSIQTIGILDIFENAGNLDNLDNTNYLIQTNYASRTTFYMIWIIQKIEVIITTGPQ